MKISLHPDYENDALYVAFGPYPFKAGAVTRTVRVSDDIFVDLDADGRLIGIDLISASRSVGDLSRLSLDTLIGVKEASEILGVRRPNFIRDYADKPDFPSPVAELATGRVWMKSQIEFYAKQRKKVRRKRPSAVTEALAKP